ncbi:major facilitator superfamily domain-containing protein [Xylariales sp. PMI_506]|nr:major facilitator superfamily domain-containing protein [Xylariales sp. PMI_506]
MANAADEMKTPTQQPQRRWLTSDFWTPRWLRWDPTISYELSWTQNILFGIATSFSVANLYYNQSILKLMARDFEISDDRASLVPTILQAGYAVGLIFVVPLGDIVYRRPLIIGLVLVTALLWLGLTLSQSFPAFLGLSFAAGFFTVTPQLMFPLTTQYAPSRHRATMISVVMSGLSFGILIARVISGIMSQYTSWRNVYWLAFGLQIAIAVLLFFSMPNYPILAPGKSYFGTLLTMIKLPFRHPVLTQQSLIAFLTMGMFTSFWTTLTFQLSNVFHFNTLSIGLFALIGLSSVVLNPVVSHFLTSRIHPSGTQIIAILVTLASVCIGTFVGTFSLAGLVIWAFTANLGMNTITVASRMAMVSVEPSAQNTVNSVYMVFTFCGQLFGTAVGNTLYARGGWVDSGSLSIATMAAALVLVFVRGPHEAGWAGWRGGWDLRKQTIFLHSLQIA